VELTAQISGAAGPALAISRLKDRVTKIANVLDKPAPDVTIVSFTPFGPVL
jgi:small conductance mechanosensitive channel